MIGQTFTTTSYEVLSAVLCKPDFIVVVLDDNSNRYMMNNPRTGRNEIASNMAVLSILLPPYASVDAFINGDMNKASMMYIDYLRNEPVVGQSISVLGATLLSGRSILFFIPPEEATSINFSGVLFNFLYDVFGINVGTIDSGTSGLYNGNPYQFATLLNIMYQFDAIKFGIYALYYPDIETGVQAPPMHICEKIITERGITEECISNIMHVPVNQLDANTLIEFIQIYIKSVKTNVPPQSNPQLVSPLVIMDRRSITK